MKRKLFITSITVVVSILLLFGLSKLMNARTFQLFGHLTASVETQQKVIALTFDDGPTDQVKQLLPILAKYNAKATFFLIGNELEQRPDLGSLIVAAGHQVGNHSYSHQRMVFKSPTFIQTELDRTSELIRQTGFTGEIMFRPPYGKKLLLLPYYVNERKMQTIMWNIEPDTNYTTVADKVQDVLNNVTPGSIILMHPMYDEQELVAVQQILDTLTKQGYTFVTVDELQKLSVTK
jgi:peptidoglycan/xylan/chitin deacetylase (PgdA/CDA1 family)